MISSVIISNGIRRIVIKEKGVSLDLPADVPYKVHQAGGDYHFLLGLEPIEPVEPEMVAEESEPVPPGTVAEESEPAQPETVAEESEPAQFEQTQECLAKPKYSKRLTKEQKEDVLMLLGSGLSRKVVADQLGITVAQVSHTARNRV